MIIIIRDYSDASQSNLSILKDYKGAALVKLAKLLRKSDMMSASHLNLLKASQMGEKTAVLQKAKWLWTQGMNQEALNSLSRAFNISKSFTGSLLVGKVRFVLSLFTR